MAAQETASSAITSLVGRTGGLLAALVVAAAIGIGVEHVSSWLDVELPFRQFMLGRNWNAVTMYRRFAWIVLGGYVLAMLAGSGRRRDTGQLRIVLAAGPAKLGDPHY